MARVLSREVEPAPDRGSKGALGALIEGELGRPVPPAVAALARQLAERAGNGAAAVLFYGSVLRDGALDGALEGVLDYYVLVDRLADWRGSPLAAAAGRLLPPNVGYLETTVEGRVLRAKYAVMTLGQFRRAMSERSLDTTVWTRFSQPALCAHARSEAARSRVAGALGQAVITAARWAAVLGPERGEALAYWRALFSRTYELELRVESGARIDALLERAPERYAEVLPLAWREGGIGFDLEPEGMLVPRLAAGARAAALRRWSRRQQLGRPLNLMRLAKAAFTFDGAMDYVVWKVERHSGVRLEVAPWERRFPLLAAPRLYYRLRRRGLIR